MKPKWFRFKWIGVFLILTGIISASSPLIATEKLELTIKSGSVDFYPGFPVVLIASLRNLAYETQMNVVHCLEPEYGFVEYLVKTPEGTEYTFIPWVYKEHPHPVKTLSAGRTFRSEAKIFFGANGWTFSTPGEYVIKAVYMKEIESNEWVLSIFTPYGPKHEEPAKMFLSSQEVGYFLLLEGGDHLEEGKRILEIVSTLYPRTIFGTYANFVLGVNLMNDFTDFRSKKIRKADYNNAVKYLEKAIYRSYSFYQSVYTHIYLAELYEKLGQQDKARMYKKGLTRPAVAEMEEFYHTFREYRHVYNDIVRKREAMKKSKKRK